MKLTEEMYLIGSTSDKICTYYDSDYVLLKKSMPITDDKLDEYISNINKAYESDVRISRVLDYRFIPGTTSSFSNGDSYTKGVFLEERAKGDYVTSENMSISLNHEYDFNSMVLTYLNKFMVYMKSLEKRAMAPQAVFDKLVWDIKKIGEFGLEIDPKPLNFFYDENNGFSIIDVIPTDRKAEDFDLACYTYIIVYGYGPTALDIDYDRYYGLPKEIKEQHAKILNILNQKIQLALLKNGFDKTVVDEAAKHESFRYEDRYTEVDMVDMPTELEELYNQKKREKVLKNNDDLNMNFW